MSRSYYTLDRPRNYLRVFKLENDPLPVQHTVYDNQDEADIVDIESVDNVIIDFARPLQYFGDNVFRIPFAAGVWAVLDYFLMKSSYFGMRDAETILIDVQDPEWNESTMWVQERRYLKVRGELAISIDVTELIKRSAAGALDTDTLLYGSEITIDALDTPEIALR